MVQNCTVKALHKRNACIGFIINCTHNFLVMNKKFKISDMLFFTRQTDAFNHRLESKLTALIGEYLNICTLQAVLVH